MATRARKPAAVSGEESGEDQHDTGGEGWATPASQRALMSLPEEPEEQSPLDRILTVLGEQADPARDTKISLYRLPKVGAREWCQDFEQHELQEGWGAIRSKWGAGVYEFRVFGYRANDTRFVLLNRTVITLAPAPEQHAPPATDDRLTAVLAQLVQGQQAIAQALATRPDPAAQLVSTMGLLAQMKEFFAPPPAAPKTSIGELVEEMRAAREMADLMAGGDTKPKTPTEQLLELAQPVLGMVSEQLAARRGAPGDPAAQAGQAPSFHQRPVHPDHPPMPLLTVPGDAPLPPAMEVSPPAFPTAPTPSSTPTAALNVPPMATNDPATTQLQAHLQELITMAAASGPIQPAAELVYDKLPDELLEVMGTGLWWQGLKMYAPAVAPYEMWFTAVREAVLKMFEDDDNAPDAPTGG